MLMCGLIQQLISLRRISVSHGANEFYYDYAVLLNICIPQAQSEHHKDIDVFGIERQTEVNCSGSVFYVASYT